MLLIGKPAPHFSANAVVNGTIVPDFSLDQFKGKKYVILFFYPKDFTFVCPTELIGFQEALGEFEKRDVAVVGCSTDSEFSHWAWINTPRSQGGIQGVTYPIVSDINKTISADYGVLAGDEEIDEDGNVEVNGELIAYRGWAAPLMKPSAWLTPSSTSNCTGKSAPLAGTRETRP